MANVEQRDLVECLFALLPNSERGLLEMRFFHNMSYRKMGHEFGVSCHCVRQAVEKILKECRRIMKYIDFGKTAGEVVAIPVINEKSLLFDHNEKQRLKLVAKREERKKLRKGRWRSWRERWPAGRSTPASAHILSTTSGAFEPTLLKI